MTRIEARPGETVPTETAEVNPAAPAAEANGSAKKGPPKKEDHPLVAAARADGGAKLVEVPTDYDPGKNSALKEDDFDGNKLDVYFQYKAAQYQAKANQWNDKAKAFARFGGIADKKTAQKVADSLATMKKSLEALAAQGVDLSNFDQAILNACGMGTTEETPAA